MQIRSFGLIGFPLGHSFSKDYFKNKFISEHIDDVDFLNFELRNLNDFHKLIEENPQLEGLTVTIPYKEAILSFMNEISDEVRKIGAMNVIKINRNNERIHLSGYNTDVYGFEKSLLDHLQPHHKQALILGTGGAAKAVAFVLDNLGINYLLVSRNPVNKNTVSYNDLTKELIKSHALIINTTPIGMFPNVDFCPDIPYKYLTDKHFLFDLTYNPQQTLFMKKGMEWRAMVCNGYNMLQYQADKAWEIWNSD
jgi:shikimate dehydrogenase